MKVRQSRRKPALLLPGRAMYGLWSVQRWVLVATIVTARLVSFTDVKRPIYWLRLQRYILTQEQSWASIVITVLDSGVAMRGKVLP